MYASVRNLATLQMNDQDLLEYLTRAQSTIDDLKLMLDETKTTFSADEYQEESVESSPLSSSPPVLIGEFPPMLNRYGITYERRLKPDDSAPIPSASTSPLAPSPDLRITIRKGYP
ncbi:hypothetical protein KIW84_058028 [Lathyrus oleraceus]|uniref:Uncharacterized protein n=1 Tax=Pisum sativum TaxID=3888 RepID=A0A9D5APP8_PEA|nr:hypothetical protein KIW84_058028 [Pisum sativum]